MNTDPIKVNWDEEPDVLTHERVAQIYGRSKQSIERRVRLGRLPMPFQTYPMRFRKTDIQADVTVGRVRPFPQRRQRRPA